MNDLDEIEQKAAALSLDEVRVEMRNVIIEQHQGKWIFGGAQDDKAGIEKHDLYVQSRVCWGIALTARERAIQVEPKAKGKGSRAAKESIAAAITEDLLS